MAKSKLEKVDLQIKSETPDGKTKSVTLSNVNPEATDETHLEVVDAIEDLQTHTFSAVNKVDTTSLKKD